MSTTTFTRKRADGSQVYYRLWTPTGDNRGAVTLVHGLGEHCGRYAHVAEAFNETGFALLGFDLQGHGMSDGLRGHIDSNEVVQADIETALGEQFARYPHVPQYLYGHSMGGCLVLRYAMTQNPGINGLIVTSPSLATGEPVPAWKMAAARIMEKLIPKFRLDNGLDRSNLSRDPQVVKAYGEDPLVQPLISTRLAMDLIKNGAFVRANSHLLKLPVLLMQGGDDHIINGQAIKEFAGKLDGKVTLKVWDGLYHELHNEPEKQTVLSEIVTWMIRHVN